MLSLFEDRLHLSRGGPRGKGSVGTSSPRGLFQTRQAVEGRGSVETRTWRRHPILRDLVRRTTGGRTGGETGGKGYQRGASPPEFHVMGEGVGFWKEGPSRFQCAMVLVYTSGDSGDTVSSATSKGQVRLNHNHTAKRSSRGEEGQSVEHSTYNTSGKIGPAMEDPC